jgi:arylsulfatase A-like enzyme
VRRSSPSLGVLIAALLTACGGSPAPPDHVIVVLVDALRADHLGCHGYPRKTSPNLDALAADATRFENAATSGPWTLPALGTMITSLYPSVHGALRPSDTMKWALDRPHFTPADALDPSFTTLAEVLQGEGFRTIAFVTGAYPGSVFGFAQGFERFAENEYPGLRFKLDALFAWLDREQPARAFAYIHTGEVHSPYTPPALDPQRESGSDPQSRALVEERARYASLDFDPRYVGPVDGSWENLRAIREGRLGLSERDMTHLVALYDRGIAYSDFWLGRLVEGLRQRGLLERTLLVVTADHGDEFFEHGGIEHTRTLYDEIMHVPLIVRAPREGRGRVVTDQVGLVDLMPTILDVLGVPGPSTLQGRSLRPLMTGGSLPERAVLAEGSTRNPRLRALRTLRWKYVFDGGGTEELYDLAVDPGERTNLCATAPAPCLPFRAQAEAWETTLAAARARLGPRTPAAATIDAETRDRLRALGYAD